MNVNFFFLVVESKQEGELSQDLYTFHEAVSALQLMEEEVLDSHKAVMDGTTGFLNDAHKVFCTTHDVDYDQEGKNDYFSLERLLSVKTHVLSYS